MTALRNSGLVHLGSTRSVSETMNELESVIRGRGLNVPARIDHSGDAAKVGLTLPPTELLIFGNSISGTPFMIAAPTAAIDLPLKALDLAGRAGTRVAHLQQSPVSAGASRDSGSATQEHRGYYLHLRRGRALARLVQPQP